MARLPIPGQDDGTWGNVLNDFLTVEHNADGTLKSGGSLQAKADKTQLDAYVAKTGGTVTGALSLADTTATVRGELVSISGDTWILTNARWDAATGEFFRIDTTKTAFGYQLQGQGYIPGEPDLGYYVAGATVWVAQAESYPLIRNGGQTANPRFGGVGGWELGNTTTSERNMTIGGMGIELDGSGTFPYGRVVNSTTGTVFARRNVGMTRNIYPDFGGVDSNTDDSWFWGYSEQYDPTNDNHTIAGSTNWTVAHIPTGSTQFNQLLTVTPDGHASLPQNPTPTNGTDIITKAYADASYADKVNAHQPVSVQSAGSTVTLDARAGQAQQITLTAPSTAVILAGAQAGSYSYMRVLIQQDSTGSRTITWPAGVKWVNGTPPTLTSAPYSLDIITLETFNGGGFWIGSIIGQSYYSV